MAPVLEFFGGQREPYLIERAEVYIGRGAACAVRLDSAGAAERHARMTMDGAGNVFIQDLDTHSGTLRNGNFVYGVQQLSEGDTIEIGGMSLTFRAAAPALSVAPAAASTSAAAPRSTAQMRASAEERTRMPTELPPEVKAALAARQQQAAQAANAPKPPPPVEAAPAGIIVGTPEPEPDNFRTVQMAPPDLAALGIDPASLPPIRKPEPKPAAAPPPQPPVPSAAKRTMMGMPAPVLPKPPGAVKPADVPLSPPTPNLGYMATAELQAQKLPTDPPTVQTTAPPSTQQRAVTPPPQTQQRAVTPPPQTPVMARHPHATAPTMMGVPRPVLPQTSTPVATPPVAPPPAMKTAQLEVPVVPVAAPAMPPVAAPYVPPSAQPKPPLAPAPQPTPVATGPLPQHAYTPPPKGSFGAFSRALAFMGQIFSLAAKHKALGKPLVYDVLLTTPIMAAFTVLELFVHSRGGFYAVMGVEAFLLYFIDYACNAITASLMYDYAMTGEASMSTAIPRVKKALPGVMTFAAVSALLDLASTYARERNDVVSKIILRVLRAIWTTATYVIMPALVIEGVSFGDAFKRSKALMDQDPTGVGAGVVAMSLTSYIVAAICFPLAYVLLHAGAHIHPAVGALLSMLIVNLYWAVSGWMKIAYATCFYMWARECERTGTTDHALAPIPLRTALDAA